MFPQVSVFAADNGDSGAWDALLAIVAVALVVYGIVQIVQGRIFMGILWFVVAALVGPGGISLLT